MVIISGVPIFRIFTVMPLRYMGTPSGLATNFCRDCFSRQDRYWGHFLGATSSSLSLVLTLG